MKNLIEESFSGTYLLVKKEDLIAFADYLLNQRKDVFKEEVGKIKDTVYLKEVLNIDELSDFIGQKKSYIYSMTSRRMIPHYKRGKRLYFKRDEIVTWLTEHRRLTEEEIETVASNYLMRNKFKW